MTSRHPHRRGRVALRVTLVATILLGGASVANASTKKVAPPCSSTTLTTDVAIYQCLNHRLAKVHHAIDVALRTEAPFLSSQRATGRRLAARAESAYSSYVRRECDAEANPYQPGTIVPIIYGECALSLFHQRLVLIKATTAQFRRGGEAAAT